MGQEPPATQAVPRDETTTIAELRDTVRAFTGARDWGRYHSPRNLAMALSVEASELLELFLWAADDGPQPPVPERHPKVADEAADVLMCLLGLCDAMDIDLAAAFHDKMRRNALKYPVEHARGRLERSEELPGLTED